MIDKTDLYITLKYNLYKMNNLCNKYTFPIYCNINYGKNYKKDIILRNKNDISDWKLRLLVHKSNILKKHDRDDLDILYIKHYKQFPKNITYPVVICLDLGKDYNKLYAIFNDKGFDTLRNYYKPITNTDKYYKYYKYYK